LQALATCAIALILAPFALAGQAAPGARPAHGLIVKFRDVSATSPRAAAQAAAADDSDTAVRDNARRLRGVIAAAGLPEVTLRPSGRAAQHLNFGRVLDGAEAARLAEALRARPEVEWVVPNERERRLETPTDPLFSRQWWLKPVSGSSGNAVADRLRGVPGFQSAWSVTPGVPAAIVAVLDTGITGHPDLDTHVLPGYDFVSEVEYANDGDGRDADPSDPGDWVSDSDKAANPVLFGKCETETSSWHGTAITGLLAAVASNGVGGASASLDGRVLPVRVAGKCGATVADIVDGMRWAAGLPVDGVPLNRNPARIINVSFGGNAACNAAYQAAIDEIATQRGAVVVAAAGNEGGAVNRPANCAGVIGVAATNRDGFKSNYSNFGAQIVIATVGGDPVDDGAWGRILGDDGLLGADNSGTSSPSDPGYSRLFGTSFAAPLASGAISLMLSVNPGLSAAQIVAGLRASARPHVTSSKIRACSNDNPGRCICTTSTCGVGLLDAAQAVLYARDPQGYVRPVLLAESIDSADVDRAMALGVDRPPNPPAGSGDSGGGALGVGWLLALASAVALLRRRAVGPSP
jgi:serine protease